MERLSLMGTRRGVAYLIVADVVVALVHAPSVRPGLECVGDALNVGDTVNEDVRWPAELALLDRLEIDCIRKQRYVRRARPLAERDH